MKKMYKKNSPLIQFIRLVGGGRVLWQNVNYRKIYIIREQDPLNTPVLSENDKQESIAHFCAYTRLLII